jgi:hypothetical protein
VPSLGSLQLISSSVLADLRTGEEESAATFHLKVLQVVGEHAERLSHPAVETNRTGSPVFVLHRGNLVSSSAPS